MNVSLTSTTLFMSLVLAISSLTACSKQSNTSNDDAPDSNDIQNAYVQQGVNISNVTVDKCQKSIDTSDGTHVLYDCTFTATMAAVDDTPHPGEGVFTKSEGNWLVVPKN
jgi:hypothetical protein